MNPDAVAGVVMILVDARGPTSGIRELLALDECQMFPAEAMIVLAPPLHRAEPGIEIELEQLERSLEPKRSRRERARYDHQPAHIRSPLYASRDPRRAKR